MVPATSSRHGDDGSLHRADGGERGIQKERGTFDSSLLLRQADHCRSIRAPCLGLDEGAYVPDGYLLLRLRKADIPAHPIRQMGDLVFRLTAPPGGRHQRARGLPGAEFPVEFIDRRRERIDNYSLWFTHDCPSRRSDAARSFHGSKTCGCGTQNANDRPVSRSRQVKWGVPNGENTGCEPRISSSRSQMPDASRA